MKKIYILICLLGLFYILFSMAESIYPPVNKNNHTNQKSYTHEINKPNSKTSKKIQKKNSTYKSPSQRNVSRKLNNYQLTCIAIVFIIITVIWIKSIKRKPLKRKIYYEINKNINSLIKVSNELNKYKAIFEFDPTEGYVGSTTGKVRAENQDSCCIFKGKYHTKIALIADGCGGHSLGKKASQLAIKYACEATIKNLSENFQDTLILAAKIFQDASFNLQEYARKENLSVNALRTTLMVIISQGDELAYYAIGDGNIYVKDTKSITPLFNPIKEFSGFISSIGPEQIGEPECGKKQISKGAKVFFGTDGVFDRIKYHDDLILELERCIEEENCSMKETIDMALKCFEETKDEDGNLIFDDNMTLGIMKI